MPYLEGLRLCYDVVVERDDDAKAAHPQSAVVAQEPREFRNVCATRFAWE